MIALLVGKQKEGDALLSEAGALFEKLPAARDLELCRQPAVLARRWGLPFKLFINDKGDDNERETK